MVQVGANRYGKAEIRVVRVGRGAGPDGSDVIRDWNVSTSLSGDLDGTHLTGDNSKVLPTDSQKNRVYALARELGAVEPETFALELASFFVSSQEPITRARIRSRSTAGRRSARPGTRSPGRATWCGRRPWSTTRSPGPRSCRGSRT
jgi:urate oxidase